MDDDTSDRHDDMALDRFQPLRPASRARLLLALVIGMLAWIALVWLARRYPESSNAIELGLEIAAGSFVAAALVLGLLRLGRRREERRYAADR